MNCLYIFKKIFLFIFIFSSLARASYASSSFTELPISAEGAVLIEYETGKILYSKNADKPMYPASTTKVLTALLALEHLDLNKVITVPEDMGPAEGSAMYLLPGERFTVRNLLDALMVKSANDAAVLLAKEISGSVESFSVLMNERAKELGAKNSNFKNPNGLPDSEHVVSPHDMALITKEAMKNNVFRELVSQVNVTLDETEQTPEKRYFRNTNRFLWSTSKIIYNNEYIPIKYDYIDGVKTGYTGEARNCLVTSGEKNGIRFIAVVFKAEGYEVYRDSRILMDYGFENFSLKSIIQKDNVLGTEEFPKTIQGSLDYGTTKDMIDVFNQNESPVYNTEIIINNLQFPVYKGDIVGKVIVTRDSFMEELDLIAFNDLESKFTVSYAMTVFSDNIPRFLFYSFISFVIFILSIFALRLIMLRKRRKRMRRKKYKNIY